MRYRILLTGGGTGGHVYPALATLEALRQRVEADFLYIGGYRGVERDIIPRYGIPLRTLWISGFQRGWHWSNLGFPAKLKVSLLQSWWWLRQFKPHVAVGTGGYVSGPVLWVAAQMGIPVLIQEQDICPGITTRLLSRWANRICLAYEGARKYLSEYEEKIVVTGNPVRKNLNFYNQADARLLLGLEKDVPVILVFGGSQGAQSLNRTLLKIIPHIQQKMPVQWIWQTGKAHFEWVKRQLPQGINHRVHLYPYLDDMALAYAASNVVVCRAGAITLAELAMVQKPAILVPYPHAAAGHQEHNARYIAQQGAALVVSEEGDWDNVLEKQLLQLISDEARQQQMAQAWKSLQAPHAADRIADEILRLLPEAVNTRRERELHVVGKNS